VKYPMTPEGYVLREQIASGMNQNKVFYC